MTGHHSRSATQRIPSVSVGLPVFNAQDHLRQALDSILAQTHTDFELIISDNSSSDATPDIVHQYAMRDGRIRHFRQATNIGVGNNWTFVARQARARFLKWASGNDEYAPGLLADCLAVMRADPAVVLCYGRTQFIDEAGSRLDVYTNDFEALSDDPLARYRVVRSTQILGTPIQSGIVRIEAVREFGYLGNYRDSDRILTAGLALSGKIVLLPHVLFFRRWGKTISTPLKTSLEVERMFRPKAQRAPAFVNARRHLGHLEVMTRAPISLLEKARGLIELLRFGNWERKYLAREIGEFVSRLGV